MRYWNPQDLIGLTCVPLSAISAVARVGSCLPAAGADRAPLLVEVATGESEADTVDLRMVVELAPRLTISRDYSEWDVDESLEVGGDRFAGNVLFDVESCLPHAASLLDASRRLRRKVRRNVSTAQGEGLPIRLVRVSATPSGPIGTTGSFSFEVEIEALGENLRARRIAIPLQPDGSTGNTLAPVLGDQRRLARTREAIGRRGADGTIDALALASIRVNRQMREAMAGLAAADRFWLKDHTALVWKDGHVSSGSNDRTNGIDWTGGHLTIQDVKLPETACAAAAGRPVTDIVLGPLFDRSMTVRSAMREADEHGTWLALELDLPRWHLDLDSGEVWPVRTGRRRTDPPHLPSGT